MSLPLPAPRLPGDLTFPTTGTLFGLRLWEPYWKYILHIISSIYIERELMRSKPVSARRPLDWIPQHRPSWEQGHKVQIQWRKFCWAEGKENAHRVWGPLTSRGDQNGNSMKPKGGDGVGKYSTKLWLSTWEGRAKSGANHQPRVAAPSGWELALAPRSFFSRIWRATDLQGVLAPSKEEGFKSRTPRGNLPSELRPNG